MPALIVLLLAFHVPPRAYVDTGQAHIPLAISSWCWGMRCGAPLATPHKAAALTRGATVRVELQFAPTRIQAAIAGTPVTTLRHGTEVTWRAAHGGGLTLRASGPRGWVTYVGRIVVRTA